MNASVQHHIRCAKGDVAKYVLLPGDPQRSAAIAEYFDDSRHVATNREYATYTGTWAGVPVTTLSTGIGGPSTAIAAEELVRVGAEVLIRVGTSGSMQPAVRPGDFVVATGAIRDEGTSQAYLPLEFPAVADVGVVNALAVQLRKAGRTHLGVIHSKDSFYGQKEPDSMPVAARLKERWSAWVQGGSLASEMESGTLFVVASARGVSAGTVCLVASSDDGSTRLTADEHQVSLDKMIRSVLDAVVSMERA